MKKTDKWIEGEMPAKLGGPDWAFRQEQERVDREAHEELERCIEERSASLHSSQWEDVTEPGIPDIPMEPGWSFGEVENGGLHEENTTSLDSAHNAGRLGEIEETLRQYSDGEIDLQECTDRVFLLANLLRV